MAHREKEPFIHRGDKVVIANGAAGSAWDVLDADWATPYEQDSRVELVVGRGGGNRVKMIFNAATMHHHSNWPTEVVLLRDINVKKPLKYRPK